MLSCELPVCMGRQPHTEGAVDKVSAHPNSVSTNSLKCGGNPELKVTTINLSPVLYAKWTCCPGVVSTSLKGGHLEIT